MGLAADAWIQSSLSPIGRCHPSLTGSPTPRAGVALPPQCVL
uniref:Uncharacterized protein n=1 Tax=Arundo donax TaxID=35708 RepID=A0A0A9ADB8_ARUDO